MIQQQPQVRETHSASALCVFHARWLLALLLVVLLAPALRAQEPDARLELTPYLGMYIPLRPLIEETDAAGTLEFRKRHVGALIFGARGAVQALPRLSLELMTAYAPSFVAETTTETTQDTDAGILLASARSILSVRSESEASTTSIRLALGAGLIHRFGEGWAGTRGTTDAALVVGAGVQWRLSQEFPYRLKFEVEDYVSRAQFHGPASVITQRRTVHEVVWSIGIVFPPGR